MRISWLMKMKTKTCAKCGKIMDENIKYCQNCGSSEFIGTEVVKARQSKPSIVHSLLYWEYDGYYMLAKSKILSIIIFLILSTVSIMGNVFGVVFLSLIISIIIFLIGYIIHKIISHPSKVQLEYSDNGVLVDLSHFFLFWQNKKTGEYVLSKTKIICHILFILFAAWGSTLNPPSFFAILLFGGVFEIIAFIIGSGIHKLTNPYPVNTKKTLPKKKKELPKTEPAPPKPEVKDESVIPEYVGYKNHINELRDEYELKDKHARELIEKRFEPPQLTHTRFIGVVDKSNELFKKQCESALTMIDLASEHSAKIENEIKTRIKVLENISAKLDDLTNELVINMSDDNDEDIHNLFDEMSDLVKSVKDYE